jgi:glutamate--cysteine ligase catalytic subunit
MEVQLTDFENAAFTVFIVLLTRVVLAFDLALYIPLSRVDENMRRAQEVDGVVRNLFFFRKNLAPIDKPSGDPLPSPLASPDSEPSLKKSRSAHFLNGNGNGSGDSGAGGAQCGLGVDEDEDAFEEMTMNEIMNGKGTHYPGLLPLVYAYLDYINCDPETYSRCDQYLQFISQRARGEIKTTARWVRDFVLAHPSYRQDSVVPPDTAHDLLQVCKAVGEGTLRAPELLGQVEIPRLRPDEAFGRVLKGRLSELERSELVAKYMMRASLKKDDSTPYGKTRASSAV